MYHLDKPERITGDHIHLLGGVAGGRGVLLALGLVVGGVVGADRADDPEGLKNDTKRGRLVFCELQRVCGLFSGLQQQCHGCGDEFVVLPGETAPASLTDGECDDLAGKEGFGRDARARAVPQSVPAS
jgi:hypothetical protein